MIQLVERKIRARAQQLYEERGYVDGFAVADWVQAESEVLEKSILAPLYWRSRARPQESEELASDPTVADPKAREAAGWESRV